MVGALLDFTRSRLGGGIPIVRAPTNIGRVVRNAVDEISAAHPGCMISVDTRGDEIGEWDAARLSQALSNVIGNAVQHAEKGTPVAVEMRGGEDRVAIVIHNRGAPIPSQLLNGIFNPMKSRGQSATPSSQGQMGSLGLGLYIAERIVSAHRGRIVVKSSTASGTTFTIYLPRHAIESASR